MRIGLIGFGTIGRALARAVWDGRAGRARLVSVLVRSARSEAIDDAGEHECTFTADPEVFFASPMEIVIEAAGHEAVRLYAERVLRGGRDLLAVSAGVFSDDAFLTAVARAAEASGRRVLIPSGALGALDAVSAAAMGEVEEVTLIVRKPPIAWKGTPAEDVASGVADTPVCFYEGGAREAAARFPQNVNVVAALSLAGVGFDRTRVKMYADPLVRHNTFELIARGAFGEMKLDLKNRPYPENPKTGHLVVMSMIKAVRRFEESIVVGF